MLQSGGAEVEAQVDEALTRLFLNRMKTGEFDPPEQQPLESLVLELKRRVVAGEVIYVHCRGGHGRTGTVVIPLIAGLFDLGHDHAKQYVCDATLSNRRSDSVWGVVHMPETTDQDEVAAAANAKARARAPR